MAQRPGVHVVVSRPAPAGEPPNRYVGNLNAEVRAHWTPLTPWGDVQQAITEASEQALAEAYVRYHQDQR